MTQNAKKSGENHESEEIHKAVEDRQEAGTH